MFWFPIIACFLSPPVVLKVVNPDGTSAVTAKVWVFRYQEEAPATSEPTPSVTDADGKATLVTRGNSTKQMHQFFARDTAGRIGSLVSSRVAVEPVVIKLLEVGDRTGRVIDADGKPIAGAVVTFINAYKSPNRYGDEYDAPPLNLPEWESRRQASRTGAEGRFKLKGVPVGYRPHVIVKHHERGEMKYFTRTDGELVAMLPRPGQASITVRGADPSALKGVGWSIKAIEEEEKENEQVLMRPSRFYRGEHPGTNQYIIPKLFPGRHYFELTNPVTVPYVVESNRAFDLKAGETTELTITLSKPAVKISGSIVEPTGKGVPNLVVLIIQSNPDSSGVKFGHVTTNAEGMFTAYGPTGWHSYRIQRPPEGFVIPPVNQDERLVAPVLIEIGNNYTFPRLQLLATKTFVARVVDASGKRVSGTKAFLPFTMFGDWDREPIKTDIDGTLRVKNLHPDASIDFRIRRGKAVNVPQMYHMAAHDKPATIEISEANAGAVSGKVIDAAIGLFPKTKVRLYQHIQGYGGKSGRSTSELVESRTTDAKGQFHFTGLWPGVRYYVSARAEGYAIVMTQHIDVASGQTTEIPEIKLARTGFSVLGIVIDTADIP